MNKKKSPKSKVTTVTKSGDGDDKVTTMTKSGDGDGEGDHNSLCLRPIPCARAPSPESPRSKKGRLE
jgi:hypothetical protein